MFAAEKFEPPLVFFESLRVCLDVATLIGVTQPKVARTKNAEKAGFVKNNIVIYDTERLSDLFKKKSRKKV